MTEIKNLAAIQADFTEAVGSITPLLTKLKLIVQPEITNIRAYSTSAALWRSSGVLPPLFMEIPSNSERLCTNSPLKQEK